MTCGVIGHLQDKCPLTSTSKITPPSTCQSKQPTLSVHPHSSAMTPDSKLLGLNYLAQFQDPQTPISLSKVGTSMPPPSPQGEWKVVSGRHTKPKVNHGKATARSIQSFKTGSLSKQSRLHFGPKP